MQFRKLETESQILDLIEDHNKASSFVVLDTETTDIDAMKARLIDVQISGHKEDEAYLFSAEYVHLLKNLNCLQVWQNFKYDWKVLYRHGVDLRGKPMRDTMLMHHLFNENLSHDLDTYVQVHFADTYKEDFWSKYKTYQEAPEAERMQYACKDIVYTRHWYEALCVDLNRLSIPDSLIRHVHLLALSLLDTEISGIAVDLDYLTSRGVELQAQIKRLHPAMRAACKSQCELWELSEWQRRLDAYKTDRGRAGCERPTFSFDSTKQLRELLYERLRLPVQVNEKTRQPTTDDAALEKLDGMHPVIPLLREYRGHQKVYGAYIEGTLERAVNGRIYPEFNVNGTKTGRISHSNPNMGQLPATGGIRGIYIPDPGCCFVSADYSQLEVVLAAHFSGDPNLLKIVREGASKHDITAESLGIPRPIAKTVNFAMQYLCEAPKVSKIVGCSEEDGLYYWNKYWETYAGEKKVVDECKAKVDAGLPIINPYGRQRRFPTEFENRWQKAKAYRQAYNALIQGTGGDIMSEAFYITDAELKRQRIGRGLFTVHDEGLIQALLPMWEQAQAVLVRYMEGVGRGLGLTVPLKAQPSGPMSRWED